MLEGPKISPIQQPKSFGISPFGESLNVKIENDQVTWRNNSKWSLVIKGAQKLQDVITQKFLNLHDSLVDLLLKLKLKAAGKSSFIS